MAEKQHGAFTHDQVRSVGLMPDAISHRVALPDRVVARLELRLGAAPSVFEPVT